LAGVRLLFWRLRRQWNFLNQTGWQFESYWRNDQLLLLQFPLIESG
jgi:hypothetical protein